MAKKRKSSTKRSALGVKSYNPLKARKKEIKKLKKLLKKVMKTDKHGRPLTGSIDQPDNYAFENINGHWIKNKPKPFRSGGSVQTAIPPRTPAEHLWEDEQHRAQQLRKAKKGGSYTKRELSELFATNLYDVEVVLLEETKTIKVVALHMAGAKLEAVQQFRERKLEVLGFGEIREIETKNEDSSGYRIQKLYNNANSNTGFGPYHVCRNVDGEHFIIGAFNDPDKVTRFMVQQRKEHQLVVYRGDSNAPWTFREWIRGRRIHEIIAGVGETDYARDQYGAWHGSRKIKPTHMLLGWDDVCDVKPDVKPKDHENAVQQPNYPPVDEVAQLDERTAKQMMQTPKEKVHG